MDRPGEGDDAAPRRPRCGERVRCRGADPESGRGGAPAPAGEWAAPGRAGHPTKSGGLLRPGSALRERFAFIRAQAAAHPVRQLCPVLGVSKAGSSAWAARQGRGPSRRAEANAALAEAIRRVPAASGACSGRPRLHAALLEAGVRCSRHRVARVMRAVQLNAKTRRRFRVATTDSQHAEPVAPNRLARQLAVAAIGAPNRVWAADYTFIPTRDGFRYLAVVLDLESRRVGGGAMRHTQDPALVLDALAMAVQQRRPGAGLVHHSDRGRQDASTADRTQLQHLARQASLSGVGNCWDHAVVESCFATLTPELVEGAEWRTREDARRALVAYLEVCYHRRRRPSTLGYRSPLQCEQRQTTAA